MAKTKVAIIGTGNIGADLMIKIMRLSEVLEVAAFVGIDPKSDGLARAQGLGVPTTADGVEGLLARRASARSRLSSTRRPPARMRSTTLCYGRSASALSTSRQRR